MRSATILGVIELGAGEEAGIAADVGDDEAGGFGLEHRGRRPWRVHIIGRSASRVTTPAGPFLPDARPGSSHR